MYVCTASCLILIGGGACIISISVEWIGWGEAEWMDGWMDGMHSFILFSFHFI